MSAANHNSHTLSDQAILVELGRRLKQARLVAGLSVTDVARMSETSRRYVTDAEAGRANVSVLKLARFAQALSVPLSELCDLGLSSRAASAERVALIGLRGAGKSTVGTRLALYLEAPFIELDQRIEELAGLRLAEIFDLHGQSGFHQLEAEALEQVLRESGRLVLAAGGSIVDAPANFARLQRSCFTVWLQARPLDHFERVLAQGDRRPMRDRPSAMEELRELLRRREPLYAQSALAIDTAGKSVDEVCGEVIAALERAGRLRGIP